MHYVEFLYTKEFYNKHSFDYFTKIVKSKNEKINYLINLEGFYKDRKKYTIEERCIYIDIASYRNFADYLFKREISVPIINVQHLYDIDKLKSNRLLTVNGRNIELKFEEEIFKNGN